eukprot:TRINITY_DN89319_c0_g1_i1.p1 TRINITY_DN89319_c0_g1~~TRINITY_DN89319_c0_g1_i1.p1  ORF type:complete len:205 (+),score=32.64 TRINITY_DN89319_c0_g1_i1:210-824(+)
MSTTAPTAGDDVNQTIAGFSGSDRNVSLTSIKKTRKVTFFKILQAAEGTKETDVKFKQVTVEEPFHDSNKIFSMMRSLPRGEACELDLEDVGFEDSYHYSPTTALQEEDCGAPGELPALVGGGWVDKEHQPDESTRLGLAVPSSDRRWKVVVVEFKAIGGKWDAQAVVSQVLAHGLVDPKVGGLFIPILQPMREHSAQGVLFVG